jgi:hypothetical protein
VPGRVRLYRPVDVRRVCPQRVRVRGGEGLRDRGAEARVLSVAPGVRRRERAGERRPDASGGMFSLAALMSVPSTTRASAMLDADRAGASRTDQTRR